MFYFIYHLVLFKYHCYIVLFFLLNNIHLLLLLCSEFFGSRGLFFDFAKEYGIVNRPSLSDKVLYNKVIAVATTVLREHFSDSADALLKLLKFDLSLHSFSPLIETYR